MVTARKYLLWMVVVVLCPGALLSIAMAEPPAPDEVRSLVATLQAADGSEPTFVAEWNMPRSEDVLTIGYSPKTGACFRATGKVHLLLRTPDGREFARIPPAPIRFSQRHGQPSPESGGPIASDQEPLLKLLPHGPRTEPSIYAVPLAVPQSLRRAIWRSPEAIESIERLDDGGFRVEASIVGEVLAPASASATTSAAPSGNPVANAIPRSLTVWFDRDARVVKWSVTGYERPVVPTYAEMGGIHLPTGETNGDWRLRMARPVTIPDEQFFDPDAVVKLVAAVAPARVTLEPDGRTLAEVAGIGQPVTTRTTRSWAFIVVGVLVIVVGVVAWLRRRA